MLKKNALNEWSEHFLIFTDALFTIQRWWQMFSHQWHKLDSWHPLDVILYRGWSYYENYALMFSAEIAWNPWQNNFDHVIFLLTHPDQGHPGGAGTYIGREAGNTPWTGRKSITVVMWLWMEIKICWGPTKRHMNPWITQTKIEVGGHDMDGKVAE